MLFYFHSYAKKTARRGVQKSEYHLFKGKISTSLLLNLWIEESGTRTNRVVVCEQNVLEIEAHRNRAKAYLSLP